MKETKEYETLIGNKILSKLSDDDYKKVKGYFDEGFPIYFMNKENYKLEREFEKYTAEENYIFVNPLCRKDIFDGRINNIKNLVDGNFKFLNHMFRFNKTLKAFSKILNKGHFDVLKQYDENSIWKYFKEVHNSYTEKTGKYIGHMETKSKLDYFPTNYYVQYITMPEIVGLEPRLPEFIRKSTLEFIKKYTGHSYDDFCKETYYRLVEMGRFDIIDETFKSCMKTSDNDKCKVVVADLFAGEGEWLNLYKKMCPYKYTYTLANEIEQNRYIECKHKKFNNSIYGAYEDLSDKIPKGFIDIMLFNPPYGETDGQRNVERFYEMMLKDNYIDNNSRVIFVINKDDYNCMINRFCENFYFNIAIEVDSGAEQDRLKQVCLIGTYNRFKDSGYYLERKVERVTELLETNNIREQSHQVIKNSEWIRSKNITECFDKFNVFKNPKMYKSDKASDAWKELINMTRIETFQGKTIKLAERPRNIGSAANLISAGLINGEIEGEHEHCIAAGTKEQLIKTLDPETGNIIVTKQSAPFLTVLTGGTVINITENKNDTVEIDEDGSVVVI